VRSRSARACSQAPQSCCSQGSYRVSITCTGAGDTDPGSSCAGRAPPNNHRPLMGGRLRAARAWFTGWSNQRICTALNTRRHARAAASCGHQSCTEDVATSSGLAQRSPSMTVDAACIFGSAQPSGAGMTRQCVALCGCKTKPLPAHTSCADTSNAWLSCMLTSRRRAGIKAAPSLPSAMCTSSANHTGSSGAAVAPASKAPSPALRFCFASGANPRRVNCHCSYAVQPACAVGAGVTRTRARARQRCKLGAACLTWGSSARAESASGSAPGRTICIPKL